MSIHKSIILYLFRGSSLLLKILESEKFILIKRGVGAFISDNIAKLTSKQKEELVWV